MEVNGSNFRNLTEDVDGFRVPVKRVGHVVRALREDVSPTSPVRGQPDLGVARIERVDQRPARPQQVLLDGLVVEAATTFEETF